MCVCVVCVPGCRVDCPGGADTDDFVLSVCEAYRRISYVWPEDICGPQPGLRK